MTPSCARASWDGKQYLFWKFKFSLHKKFIFHFLNAKNGFFMKHCWWWQTVLVRGE
jgi:hypothetical protein